MGKITEKICFVAMGFGKKMDYENSVQIDLDNVYKKVIKNLFHKKFEHYKLVRGDEIAGSAVIDASMYAFLIEADLVIADITTLNPNAIYELGIRHAAKPFSTILMAQKNCRIPFDLNHSRFLIYDEITETSNIKKIQEKLEEFIIDSEEGKIDSPLYTFIPECSPPRIEKAKLLDVMKEKEKDLETIATLMRQANDLVDNSDFKRVIPIWKKLREALPNNTFVVQQLALAIYKAKQPNETLSLLDALCVIKTLNPETSLDLETVGITGSIYKKLFFLNQNFDYLDEAIRFYQKGYIIKNDYYNGENYANCLLFKSTNGKLPREEISMLIYMGKQEYKKVIAIILANSETNETSFWEYATLATSYYVIGNTEKHEEYQQKFFNKSTADWERDAYEDNLAKIKNILGEVL